MRFVLAASLCTLAAAGSATNAAAAPKPAARKAGKPVSARTAAAVKPAARPTPKPVGPVLKSLELFPAQVTLSGARGRQLLLVTGTFSDGTVRDVSTEVKYASAGPKVAAVSTAGLVTPVADGRAEVRVALGKVTAKVPVTVARAAEPAAVSFTRDIVPLLTQGGCNSLSCHGSPVGKSGFKLSMYGSDPADDFNAIVNQERTVPEKGKRVDADAEKSLILAKPTMTVPHQGGMRFKIGSPEHQTLTAWLRGGMPNDTAEAAKLTALEIAPADRVLSRTGQKQRLLVTARYADGAAEDVTAKVVYLSNDDSVAGISEGVLEAAGVGETAVLARYLGQVGTTQVYVPQSGTTREADYAGFRPVSYVDRLALAKWRKMGYVPSALCTDAEYLRRVRLDLTGTLPTPDEVRAFTADPALDKREKKVDELLATPEYADWWTVFWGDGLRNNSRLIQQKGAVAYRGWIRQSVVENKPYDRFARELVTATGGNFSVGPASFYRVANSTVDRAEQVAQLFLGIRLNCAQCHNHPFEKWTRTDYHEFAAIFTRVQTRGGSGGETLVSVQPKGEYRAPERKGDLAPAVLGDDGVQFPNDRDRREVLADWLVSPQNPLFARNLVNRVWAQLFGRGIVEPVDDVRVTNPAVNEPLLQALAKDFVEHGHDVRALLRTLATSRTYQLSAQATPRNRADRQSFSRAYFRRLKAEALIDGICQATAEPEKYQNHPAGTRAIQLTDNRVASYFLDVFGRPKREIVCTCEREETANISQVLQLMNGPINQKIGSGTGRLAQLLKSGKADRDVLDELYLWTVSRPPTAEEAEKALAQLAAAGEKERKSAFEDQFWVLLNSREFLFNH